VKIVVVGIYVRVSTDEQALHGFSIDNQKERLESYCISQGWDDYRFYIDDGYTGTNMERPALERMIKHIKEGKINLVVVYKLDRLGRKQKDVLYLLEDVFDKHNVPFKSSTEPFDTSTTLGRAMLGILAVFAQLERDTIIERTTSGRRQRVKKGMWYGGRIPFGYSWNKENQELEIIPEEAELVQKTFSMFLQGHSTLSISEWLADRSKARVFDHSVVRDILKRTIYTGRMDNAGEIVEGRHEAIIDQFTFDRVQKEIAKRKAGRAAIGDYLLSGMLRCGVCGGSVIHVFSKRRGKTYEYYACKAQHVRKKDRNNNCSLGYTRKEKLDSWVVDRLKNVALYPLEIESELKNREALNQSHEDITSDLQEKLDDIEKKLDRWYDAFEQGTINPSQLKKRIETLEEEKKSIILRLEDHDDSKKVVDSEVLFETLDIVNQTWDLMTFEEQKVILRVAIEKLVLHPKQDPEIYWNF
jgi:site-specific DNA recombinase